MNRRILALLFLCALTVPASATTFRANIRDIIGVADGSRLVIEPAGCGTFMTRAPDRVIVPRSVTLYPNANGDVPATNITDQATLKCGPKDTGQPYYVATIYYKNSSGILIKGPSAAYDITGASFDMNSAPPRAGALVWLAAGMPVGGAIHYVLAKKSAADYDVEWVSAPTGGGGTGAGVSSFNGVSGDILYTPAWADLTGKPSAYPTDWSAISNIPSSFPSTWDTVTGKPTTFIGDWDTLANKPSTFPPPVPSDSTLGGIESKTCTGTDKVSGIGTDGVLVCTPDQTTTGGTGITSFDGSVASSQSLDTPGTAGTAPAWTTNTDTGVHHLDIPLANTASVTAGLISNAEFTSLGNPAWGVIQSKPSTFPSDWNTTINKPGAFPSDWASVASKPTSFFPTLPTSSLIGGVFSDAACPSGQHFASITLATGHLNCTADAPAWSNVTGTPSSFPSDWSTLSSKPLTFAPSAHVHAAADVNSGTLGTARLGSGSASGSVFLAGDSAWKVVDWSVLANKPATFAPSTHSHAEADVTGLNNDLNLKAPIASPTFTGTPAAPNAGGSDDSTQIATTHWVRAIAGVGEGPTYTGNKTIAGNLHVTGQLQTDGPWTLEGTGYDQTASQSGMGKFYISAGLDLMYSKNGAAGQVIAMTGSFEAPLTFSSPFTRVGNTIAIPLATNSVNGYLSSADRTAFNAKLSAIPALTASALGGVKGSGGILVCNGTDKINGFASDGTMQCTADSGGYTNVYQVDANTISLRNSTNAQLLQLYGTYTDASNYERLTAGYDAANTLYAIKAQYAGSGVARGVAFATGGSNRWQVDTSGHFRAIADNTYDIGTSGAYRPRRLYLGTELVTPLISGVTSTAEVANLHSATASALAAGAYATKLLTREFHFKIWGSGTANALQATDDELSIWRNELSSVHITKVVCEVDTGTTTTIQLQKDDGSPTNMLSADLTCGTTATSTTTFVSGEDAVVVGDRIDYLTVAAGTAHWVAVTVVYTID